MAFTIEKRGLAFIPVYYIGLRLTKSVGVVQCYRYAGIGYERSVWLVGWLLAGSGSNVHLEIIMMTSYTTTRVDPLTSSDICCCYIDRRAAYIHIYILGILIRKNVFHLKTP